MKIRTYFLLAIVLAFFAGLGHLHRGKSMGRGGPGRALPGQARSFAAFMVPISFYGRAVDQHGNSVAGADVYFSANDVPWEDGSEFRAKTDAEGNFQLNGAKGTSLYVRLMKKGYDTWYAETGKQESMRSFDYDPHKEHGHKPDKANPVIFKLRKLGVIEPLEVRSDFTFVIPGDGSWRLISLHADKSLEHGVNFRCVSKLDTVPFGESYDWEFEISVPKGGLVERTDRNLFVAPEEGYKPSDKVLMLKDQPNWTKFLNREYFIRFEDGVVARVKLEIYVRDRQLVACESWMNLKTGSRELEVEPVRLDE